MNKMIFFFMLFISFSCSKKEEQVNPKEPKNPLYEALRGKYDTDAILVKNPVDINKDGMYSNNLFSEFEYSANSSKNRLEIKTNQLLDLELLTISFPYSSEKNIVEGSFYSDWVVLGGKYEIQDDELISEDEVLTSIKLVDDKTIEVKGEIDLYTSEGWEKVAFEATYEKR